jgi:hypothetical protein
MDIALAAAMLMLARQDGSDGYEGATMFSALPSAPVVERRVRRHLARPVDLPCARSSSG